MTPAATACFARPFRSHAAVAAPGQAGIDAEDKHSFDRNRPGR